MWSALQYAKRDEQFLADSGPEADLLLQIIRSQECDQRDDTSVFAFV